MAYNNIIQSANMEVLPIIIAIELQRVDDSTIFSHQEIKQALTENTVPNLPEGSKLSVPFSKYGYWLNNKDYWSARDKTEEINKESDKLDADWLMGQAERFGPLSVFEFMLPQGGSDEDRVEFVRQWILQKFRKYEMKRKVVDANDGKRYSMRIHGNGRLFDEPNFQGKINYDLKFVTGQRRLRSSKSLSYVAQITYTQTDYDSDDDVKEINVDDVFPGELLRVPTSLLKF
jgi:hypothetical protein